MQRTVKTYRFTYIETDFDKDGNIVADKRTVTVAEDTLKKALKVAVKQVGMFAPKKIEIVSTIYRMDDTFFINNSTPDKEPISVVEIDTNGNPINTVGAEG